LLKPSPKVYWYYEKKREGDNSSNWSFSKDASCWVASATTVTIAGLQLAVYLGFNPIFLIGCDTTYSIPRSVVFEVSAEKLVSTQNDDPNHFSSNYFGKGDKWSLPNVDLMIHQYEQSKKVLDEVGVCVYNATIDGHLEIFPRVSFEGLFREQ
jgi:hypothetical protein